MFIWLLVIFLTTWSVLLSGGSGKHRRDRYCGWEPQADIGPHLEYYPSLAGEQGAHTHAYTLLFANPGIKKTDDGKSVLMFTHACMHVNMYIIQCFVCSTCWRKTAQEVLS